jgi:hypothetical protein
MGTTATTAASGSPVTISPIPTSTLGTRKAFTTQFGNMVEGLYITWGNTISSATGDAASAEMQIDLDFHWYNNSIDSIALATNPLGVIAGTNKNFVWEIMILNPDATTYFLILKDSWEGTLTAATTASSPTDLLTVKWAAANPLVDYAYKDTSTRALDTVVNLMGGGGAAAADGGTNDLTILDTLTTDLCTEKWAVLTSN